MKNTNKNILVLTTTFPLQHFSVGIHIYDKCKFLTKKGLHPIIVTPHHEGERIHEFTEGMEIIRFPYFYPFIHQRVAYQYGLVQNIKKFFLAKLQLPLFLISFICFGLLYGKKCRIIHAHWFPAGLVGIVIKKLLNKKLVLMMHHSHKANIVYKYILRNTDYLLANSSYVLQKTLNIYPVPKARVMPVPINHKQFKRNSGENSYLKKKLRIMDNDVFVFSAGRFIDLKGFEYLIKAFRILIYTYKKTNIQLRIAGEGPRQNDYENLIGAYNLKDYVTIIGYISNDKIHEYYNAADIFIIPSIVDRNEDTEGFGLVSLEANACETPVIGTRVGGIVDVIKNNYNGFLVEPKNPKEIADKIVVLAENEKLRLNMGKNGRKRVIEKFDWVNIIESIIDVYEQV